MLTGEKPEVNAGVAARLAEYGHADFTAYVVWTCERALERGLLPHTNLGVLSREDLARLREVTASQGLMLESVSERLMQTVHAGSPTKHPARRLETIRAAGELKIPFTSGILVGIGETEDERVASLEALASAHAEHGHIQEVILQNFVPHQRYYGQEPAEIADAAARAYWQTGVSEDGSAPDFSTPSLPLPEWACPVSIEDMKRLISETRRLMPDVGIQIPPNLADWWSELVAAGATDLGGLSANGDHISPEHPFPSPHQVRKQLQRDGYALTERLCVYPQYIDAEWVAHGVLDTIKAKYWSFIPRRGSGRTEPPAPIRRDLVAGAIAKGRDGMALSADELTAMFAETRPEAIEEMREAADELRAELAGETVTFVVNRNINVSNVCTVGCAFCGFGQGKRSPDAYEHDREEFARRVARGGRLRRHRAVHPVGHPPRLGPGGLPRLAALCQADRAAAAPARLQPDGDRAHVRHLRSAAEPRCSRSCATPAWARRPAPPRRFCTTACASASPRTSCRSRAGCRSSRPRTAPACARPRRSCSATSRSRGSWPSTCASCASCRNAPAASPSSCRCRSSPSRRCSVARTASRRSRARRTSSTPPCFAWRSGAAIPSLQASWVKMGLDAATESLRWGVNDLGGTLMEESISRLAGSYHGTKLDPDELVAAAHRAGRPAAERTTLYEIRRRYEPAVAA